MSVRKIAISIDPDLLRQADKLARSRRTSRSGLIADLIARAAKANSDRAITRALDEVYGNGAAAREQKRLTRERYAGEVFGDGEW
jgi:metal-responsive CopG/Arc/MetJ family transcriptional regulator